MDAMSGKYHDITAKYLSVMQLYTLLLTYLLSVLINLEVRSGSVCTMMCDSEQGD